jgi:ferredoxin
MKKAVSYILKWKEVFLCHFQTLMNGHHLEQLAVLPTSPLPAALLTSLPLVVLLTNKGYHISDECIRCGTGKEGCPQDAIEEGSPFTGLRIFDPEMVYRPAM